MAEEVEWFKRFPGGGTVFVKPQASGEPDATVDEDPSSARPVVVVDLPLTPFEENQS